MTAHSLTFSYKQWAQAQWVAVRWVWRPLALLLATRLAVGAAAYVGMTLLPDSADPPPYHLRGVDIWWLDAFGSRWDTGFYVSIVEEGYKHEDVPFPSTPFFPLLPLLMRAVVGVGDLLRLEALSDAVVAGLLTTNLALVGASLLFYRLVWEEWGEATAGRAVWYLLIFPTSFFGSAIYTESLFLLTAIGALYAARHQHWGVAALLGIAASLTRLVGVIVAPLLLLEWWLGRSRAAPAGHAPRSTLADWAGLGAALATPLGTLAYMAYLWRTFGDPIAFVTGSAAWGRVAQTPAETLARLFQTPAEGWWAAWQAGRVPLNDWVDLGLVLLFLFLGFVLLYQHRWSEGIFVWLGVMIPFSSGLLMSQRRYMWVLFPAFVLLARWGARPWVDRLLTALSLTLLALMTVLFANGYWVG